MYGNMTREEMIRRLYEGNFTTGELERQLIAKLFEQCCGGGSGSSGGETLIVHINENEGSSDITLDKTAAEIFGAFQSSGVIMNMVNGNGNQMCMALLSVDLGASGSYSFTFANNIVFRANTGNDYPIYGDK